MTFGWALEFASMLLFLLAVRLHVRRPASRLDWMSPWLLGMLFVACVLLPGYLLRP